MICRNAFIWFYLYIYICCIYVCNLLPRLIKNLSNPLYLWKIVTSIFKLSRKTELHLNRVGRGLQRFLLAFPHFFEELKNIKKFIQKNIKYFFPFF